MSTRNMLKLLGALVVIGGVFFAGLEVGYKAGNETSYKKLLISEQRTALRNMIVTASALRRANTEVYVNELDSLIYLEVSQIHDFTPISEPLEFAKAYYTTFSIPIPKPIQRILADVTPMPQTEFDRIVNLPVSNLVHNYFDGPSTK